MSVAAVLIQPVVVSAEKGPEYVSALSFGKADRLPSVCALAVGKDEFLVVAAVNKVFVFDPAKEQSVRSFDTGFA